MKHRSFDLMTLRGFTLVEVLMTLAIIAVLATIASPRYADAIARYRVDLAARQMASDLRLAQAHARATSASIVIRFDPAAETYHAPGLSNPHNPGRPFIINLSAEPFRSDLRAVSMDDDSNEVSFDGYGTLRCSGRIGISNGNHRRWINLDAIGSRVTIES